MSEKKIKVDMEWIKSVQFEATVPADMDDDAIEDLLRDCEEECRDLNTCFLRGSMPIDGEETAHVTKIFGTDTEFNIVTFYGPEDGYHG